MSPWLRESFTGNTKNVIDFADLDGRKNSLSNSHFSKFHSIDLNDMNQIQFQAHFGLM